MIKQISKAKEDLMYKLFCDKCNAQSICTNSDPGDLALKAKQEKFITVQSGEIYEPMQWLCRDCGNPKPR